MLVLVLGQEQGQGQGQEQEQEQEPAVQEEEGAVLARHTLFASSSEVWCPSPFLGEGTLDAESRRCPSLLRTEVAGYSKLVLYRPVRQGGPERIRQRMPV